MRPHLWEPSGEMTAELLVSVLSLVNVAVTVESVTPWTRLERVLAYDWAMREHRAASDSLNMRREKPWLVQVAERQSYRAPLVPAGRDRFA